MVDFSEFADQLQQEVVTDMAESYFGARKDLDDMIEAFNGMVAELREMEPSLSQAAARLHHLLLDRQTAKEFYITLDILPSCIPFTRETPRPFFASLPFAFTGAGRYEKCVSRAYDLLQKTADVYLNGKYYESEEYPGKKRLTVHYIRLKALCEHINEKIAQVNEQMSPSNALRYVKEMDPVQVEREKTLGQGCLSEGCSLDNDLRFTPIDFKSLGLLVIQDLPPLRRVREAINVFCRSVYQTRTEEVQDAMDDLKEDGS